MVELFTKFPILNISKPKWELKCQQNMLKSGKIDRSRNQFVESVNERNFWCWSQFVWPSFSFQARVTTRVISSFQYFSSEKVFKVSRSPTIFQRQDNSDLCLPFLSCLFVLAKTPWRNLCYSDRNIGYSGVIQPADKYLLYYHYHYTSFCNSLEQLHITHFTLS